MYYEIVEYISITVISCKKWIEVKLFWCVVRPNIIGFTSENDETSIKTGF